MVTHLNTKDSSLLNYSEVTGSGVLSVLDRKSINVSEIKNLRNYSVYVTDRDN